LPRLLHRQIFLELLSVFALCAGSLLTLLLIGRMLQLRELLFSQSLTFWDVVCMFAYLSPFFLLLLIPIACMLAVFLTFLRMGTDLESVALRASGVSLYQMLPAPLAFCALCTVAACAVSFWGLSWGMENFRATVLDLARTKTQLVLQGGVFNRDFPGLTIYAQQADPARGDLRTVFVQDRTREHIIATILAPTGRVSTDTDRGEIVFHLQNGRIYRQEAAGLSVVGFDTYAVRMDLSRRRSGYNLGSGRCARTPPWSRTRAAGPSARWRWRSKSAWPCLRPVSCSDCSPCPWPPASAGCTATGGSCWPLGFSFFIPRCCPLGSPWARRGCWRRWSACGCPTCCSWPPG
jgi:lipopolysaccharide export system permease protein